MNLKGLSALLSFIFIVLFFSCTKVNEATDIGGDLLPAVDNVHTFDTTLDVTTAYHLFDDTTKNYIGDYMALGKINDPLFGTANADMYFNLSSPTYGTSPFGNKDSITSIDSVVLSLAFVGSYGDTTSASQFSVQVSEIAPGNDFYDTSLYRFDHPAFSTTGSVLGSKNFIVANLRDSTTLRVRKAGDTTKVVNVLRIPLNNSIGLKLKGYDTTASGPYQNDSLFRKAFRGLAVKTSNVTGNGAFAYFNLSDATHTQLIVYYKTSVNNVKDTASAAFVHSAYSQANSVIRNPSGSYLANINNPAAQNLYLQSSPSGSYVGIKIPGLDTFSNKVINRAELIAYKVPSLFENFFTPPSQLFLDHKGQDTAYMFQKDLSLSSDGLSYNFPAFGGTLKSDNSYRFNITRYVQGIVTRKDHNDSLRLYAPLRSTVYDKNTPGYLSLPNLTFIAAGRVVLASGSPANGNTRLRLHIIYSNL